MPFTASAHSKAAPYLVSELLEGETLRQQLERGPLPVRKVIDYGVQIAHGLAAAHDKGIVHRDLKPENLFITKNGRIKILDFGLAKLIQSRPDPDGIAPTQTRGTDPGMVVGTVGYMSPEQVRGKAVDHRADIFAFGAILYEMLAGKRAFQRPTSADTMSAILNEDPPGISQIVQTTPPGLAPNRPSLPGEERRAALSVCIGSGVCAGSLVGIGHLLSGRHRSSRVRAGWARCWPGRSVWWQSLPLWLSHTA